MPSKTPEQRAEEVYDRIWEHLECDGREIVEPIIAEQIREAEREAALKGMQQERAWFMEKIDHWDADDFREHIEPLPHPEQEPTDEHP